jgi:serine/threonine protein kinase
MDVDARVDIYALGVTLCQFLTGELPFDGPTPMAVLLNVVNEHLVLPKEVFDPLPKEVRDAIIAMTAKDPKRRLPNIAATLAVLKSARDALRRAGMDSTAPLKGPPRSSSPEIKDPVSSMIAATRASRFSQPRPDSIARPRETRVNPLPPRKPGA